MTLSNRKADKEGHVADVLCDAISRAISGIRFRRRGVPQESNVDELLRTNIAGSGSVSLRGVNICFDRGYSKMKEVLARAASGIGGIYIMPDHLNNVHPFVAKSRHSNCSERIFDESECAGGGDAPDFEDVDEDATVNATGTSQTQVKNRERKFIVDDSPNLGPAVFVASRRIRAKESAASAPMQVYAVSVPERGDKNFCKVHRFAYCIPGGADVNATMSRTWIANPRPREKFRDELEFASPALSSEGDQAMVQVWSNDSAME